MKYTAKEYKEFIIAFSKDKNYSKRVYNKLDKDFIYNADLLNDEDQVLTNVLEDLLLSKLCGKSKRFHSLTIWISYLNNLYNWFIEKQLISFNPFNSDKLNEKTLYNKLSMKADLRWYTPDDIENIIGKLHSYGVNADMYESIIRLFYEGIPEIKAMANLKWSDFDKNICVLYTDDFKIELSDKLSKAIKKYKKMDEYCCEGRYNFNIPMAILNDCFIKKIEKSNRPTRSTDEMRSTSTIRIVFKNISLITGIKIDYKDLYYSGFINYVRENCNNDDRFIDLFFGLNNVRPEKEFTNSLEILQKKYNSLDRSGWKIRKYCQQYIVKIPKYEKYKM